MSKYVRLVNGAVYEIVPAAAATPGVAYWYGAAFAAKCVEAPDEAEQGWTYDAETETFSKPVPEAEPEPTLTTAERLAALEAAAADADALTVDLAYRTTLLELGVSK